jgi:alkylation response protein AidB-like acyl-CoA dehydrogenase
MEIKLNEDQVEMRRQARRFFDKECSMDYVREMFEDPRGFTDDIWRKMVEMGWTAMLLPEAYGGLEMEIMDLCVVIEEMGRSVIPGPFFSAVLLAGEAIKSAGNDTQKQEYLSGIASGELRGTLALNEPDGGADPDYVQMGANLVEGDFILNGTKIFVLDAHAADFLVVAARTSPGDDPSNGISLFLTDPKSPGITITPFITMDGTRKQCAVEFKDVRIPQERLLGERNQGWGYLSKILSRAQVALAAENVGGAEKCLEMAGQYAKERVQFGQQIGAFQAIKHPCAQMFVEVESSRSLLYWAAWNQDYGNVKDAQLSALAAKVYCSENYKNTACRAIQILGGIGFTWEHDLHLYLKRAKANEVIFGDPLYGREEMVRIFEGEKG